MRKFHLDAAPPSALASSGTAFAPAGEFRVTLAQYREVTTPWGQFPTRPLLPSIKRDLIRAIVDAVIS
jgi:hypothetical protein